MIKLISIFIFFTILTFSSAMAYIYYSEGRSIERLKHYDPEYAGKLEKNDEKSRLQRRSYLIKKFKALTSRISFLGKSSEKLREDLKKVDMKVTVEELQVIKILSSTVIAFFAFVIFRDFLSALLFFAITWNIPKFIILRKISIQNKLFEEQINYGIVIIANSLRAGHSFLQSITLVAEETPDPFSKEFKRLLKEINLGVPVGKALRDMADRMNSADFSLFVNAVLIQMKIGGNLAEILDNISETIRERQKIKNEIKTLTAQGRLSGIIIMGIPLVIGIFFYLFNREHIMLLFTTTPGLLMLGVAALGQVIGFFVIRNIIDIDIL